MWQVLYLTIVGPCINALMNINVHNVNLEGISVRGGSTIQNVFKTNQGDVQGYVDDDGILQFFDIPYGKLSEDYPFQVNQT